MYGAEFSGPRFRYFASLSFLHTVHRQLSPPVGLVRIVNPLAPTVQLVLDLVLALTG